LKVEAVKISSLYQKNLDPVDHLVLHLEATLILSGFVCIVLNAVTFRYSGNHYISLNWMWMAPLLLGMAFFASLRLKKFPAVAFLLKSYSLYFLAFFAFLVLLDGVQYTPFPTVDMFLSAADRTLLINETSLIDWSYAHPLLLIILKFAYHSVVAQWLVTPLLLFILRQKEQFYVYLTISLLAYLIGAAIYYFFPTVGPAGIFHDSHFSRAQIDTVLNFREIHQYLMVTTMDGGMIAFPSFHVLWSVITVYALRSSPKPFFMLLLILNVIAIIATLLLGWNYAVDISCGILVGVLAIFLGNRLIKGVKSRKSNIQQIISQY
jgi:PAP2 superfamily